MKINITEFVSAFESRDPAGRVLPISSRQACGLIIPFSGKIVFSTGGKEIVTSPGLPIFIPQGHSYRNRCIEDAFSYNINFLADTDSDTIVPLEKIAPETAKIHFDKLAALSVNPSIKKDIASRFFAFSELYALLGLCSQVEREKSTAEKLFDQAVRIICENFADPSLSCADIAKKIYISPVYLRRIFSQHASLSPYQYIVKIRMEQAHAMLLAQTPVKQVALQCGYADVYGFSKAYVRYYGYSPVKTR